MVTDMARAAKRRPRRRNTAVWADLPFDRIVRIGLKAAVVLALAALAFHVVLAVSVAGVYRTSRPGTALNWVAIDSPAAANLSARILENDPSPEIRDQLRVVAVDALRRDPTNVVALRVLGRLAEDRDEAQAARMFGLAERLSRRDQLTQAWLIAHHLNRDDPVRAIRGFDIALRTSNNRWDVLMPLLAAVTADPRALPPLAELLSQTPPWEPAFLRQLAISGPRLDHVRQLLHGRLDPAHPDGRAVIQILLNRLVADEQFAGAWDTYRVVLPGDATAIVRDGAFDGAGGLPPFDWNFVQDAELGAIGEARPDAGDGKVLSVYAYGGRSGEVARQLVRLSPGAHRLQADAGQMPADPLDRPLLRLVCAQDGGATLVNYRPPTAGAPGRRLATSFTVPAGCGWGWLTINMSGAGSATQASPWIDNIAIVRASP